MEYMWNSTLTNSEAFFTFGYHLLLMLMLIFFLPEQEMKPSKPSETRLGETSM